MESDNSSQGLESPRRGDFAKTKTPQGQGVDAVTKPTRPGWFWRRDEGCRDPLRWEPVRVLPSGPANKLVFYPSMTSGFAHHETVEHDCGEWGSELTLPSEQ